MSKSTPGPWTSGGSIYMHMAADIQGDGRGIAQVWRHNNALADADLIAAAPDLLAACRAALDWRGFDGGGINNPVRQQLIAAIAKAEGGKL